ncbi:MAG: IS1634 family transposase [Planctomycetota bacterium]|jgi:transposase
MFLRVVKARGGAGVEHEYVRLVESYREGGKSRQRVVCNLGRKDLLAEHLESLERLLRGESRGVRPAEDVEARGAWDWGPVRVARALWQELGLESILDGLGGRGRPDGRVLSERAFVLVANRLCAPTSEHGLARWLETHFVCDRQGRRWVPQWRADAERRSSRLPRVRVELRQLKQWYRTLDHLQGRKAEIEQALYLQLRDLFSLKVDLVLYDLTSTYFEGAGPRRLGAHGYSRDGRPRNRQVLVGVVLVDGWPIAHHVFAGNWRDSTTVPQVLRDLEKRFGLRRIVFVGDRGMVTRDNLALLRARGQGYVVGRQRRRSEEIYRYIERATGRWLECPVGIAAEEKADPPRTRVQEVPSDRPSVRIFVVHSDERLAFERTQRLRAMGRVRGELVALAERVRKGQLKAPAKIGAAAARILSRNHGHRYYDWAFEGGVLQFFEHPVHLLREKAYEGKYVIQTEEKDLSPLEAVRIYKELSDVERAFASLKDVIEMRPIYHQRDDRVQAHIFVAALALLLHRALEKKLKQAGLDLSATEALQALTSVRVVDLDLGAGQTKRCVTRGSARAAAVLRALGISELKPPTPPRQRATVA